jgi:macrolide-specific efflux system membrane fusion protein
MNLHHTFAFIIAVSALSFGGAAPAAEPLVVESVVLRLLAEAEVPAQEGGVITSVAVNEGARVKQGELLAQVDDEVARLAAAAAHAQFEIAQAKAANEVRLQFARKALQVSEAELRRSTESVERFPRSVSESQLDVERLTVEKHRLEVEQALHEQRVAVLELKSKDQERSAARAQVTRRRIVAPLEGVVVQVLVRSGEWIEPGEQAVRIVNIDRLKAEGFLPASQASADLVGRPVELRQIAGEGAPTQSFSGAVVFVSPEVDPITGQVRIWAEIDNRAGSLRPGQPVSMVIVRP